MHNPLLKGCLKLTIKHNYKEKVNFMYGTQLGQIGPKTTVRAAPGFARLC